jgi:hypothetical protein
MDLLFSYSFFLEGTLSVKRWGRKNAGISARNPVNMLLLLLAMCSLLLQKLTHPKQKHQLFHKGDGLIVLFCLLYLTNFIHIYFSFSVKAQKYFSVPTGAFLSEFYFQGSSTLPFFQE